MHKKQTINLRLGIVALLACLTLCALVRQGLAEDITSASQPPSTSSVANLVGVNEFAAGQGCDYFDYYGCFLISFPRSVKLGPSGPSATSGIKFQFDENNWLAIHPSTATYNPDFPYYEEEPEHIPFVRNYAGPDCKVEDITQPGFISEIGTAPDAFKNPGNRIICPDYEYTIIPVSLDQSKYVSYHIYIQYQHTGGEFDFLYREIVNSMLIFKGEERKKAYDVADNAGMTYRYYDLDPGNPWSQPRHYCLDDRIRGQLAAP